ncbi:MAG: hypothetical protein M1829_006552 [Trizodia sp. TS-e1964]|nr:MAG: hypothetical protein M1829_006552 [Trizodia sp. TS-e1964]
MAGNKSIKSFFKPSTSTNTPRKYPEDVLTSKHFKRNPPSIQKASPLPSSRLATALEQQDSPPSAPHLPMPDSNRVSSGLHSVLKPGTTVIRSSDDEYGDSDDGDLEELDALLRTRRQKVAGETPLPPEVSIKPARGRPRKKAPQNPCKPEIPQYKFSLESLVVQNKEQLAAASRSAQARAALHLLSRNDGEDGKRTGDRVDEPTAINKSLLASVVGESGEEAGMKKVLHALQRTEALNRGKAWSFFSPRKAAAKRPYHAFPTQVISDGWQHELIDPNMRIHTFLSGFAAEMMKLDNAFPDELRLWILDECG